MPAWFFAQLSLNEEHACSTVNLISLTISENRKTVNVRGLILAGDIHPKLNYQRKLIFQGQPPAHNLPVNEIRVELFSEPIRLLIKCRKIANY